MDDHLLKIFRLELKTQCEHAEVAVSQLDAAMQTRRSAEIWSALEGILSIAGNASKMLWGSGGEGGDTEARRKPLRDSVGVGDDSPLRSRQVRNAFEHFDERIERWHAAGDTRVYSSRNVGQPGQIVIAGEAPPKPFGNFNPRTGVVTFWDWEASIPDLLAELQSIHAKLTPY